MDNSITYYARHGDYSRISYLLVWEERGEMCIRSVIDHEKRYESPNPRFTAGNAGGRSCDLRSLLQELVLEVKDEGSKLLLSSVNQMTQLVIHLGRDGDCVVSTEDRSGGIGVTVRFVRRTAGYRAVKGMLRLIEKHNRTSPNEDAAKAFEKDRPHLNI